MHTQTNNRIYQKKKKRIVFRENSTHRIIFLGLLKLNCTGSVRIEFNQRWCAQLLQLSTVAHNCRINCMMWTLFRGSWQFDKHRKGLEDTERMVVCFRNSKEKTTAAIPNKQNKIPWKIEDLDCEILFQLSWSPWQIASHHMSTKQKAPNVTQRASIKHVRWQSRFWGPWPHPTSSTSVIVCRLKKRKTPHTSPPPYTTPAAIFMLFFQLCHPHHSGGRWWHE